MNDILWISVDYAATVLGIQQTVLGSGSACDSQTTIDKDALEEFNTDVLIKRSEIGQVYVSIIEISFFPVLVRKFLHFVLFSIYSSRPDTASFVQKVEREREARDHGDTKDQRGFFAKYWMYIVPVAVIVLISGATSPDQGAAGGR